jgi:signal transduction histidine kinase
VHKGLLTTISQILALDGFDQQPTEMTQPAIASSSLESPQDLPTAEQQERAEREWFGAIAALNTLLHTGVEAYPLAVSAHQAEPIKGVILSGPAPVIDSPSLAANFSNWIFTPESFNHFDWLPFQLLPCSFEPVTPEPPRKTTTLPLLPQDPIAAERFCVVLTTDFSLVLVLGQHPAGYPAFQFSFEPQVVEQVWRSLRSRLVLTSAHVLQRADDVVAQFASVPPDYRLVTQFTRLMLAHVSNPPVSERLQASAGLSHTDGAIKADSNHNGASSNGTQASVPVPQTPKGPSGDGDHAAAAEDEACEQLSIDAELLRAMAHEIRTPLTTIRTLTRSLLKRKDLDAKVVQRLNTIDQECTRQIDRFSLIFRAVELETRSVNRAMGPLSAMSLDQIFQENIPRWQQQASQRNINLEVLLPKTLPSVVSDPIMLNQVLTGLIERFTHSLPIGSGLQLGVMLAGHQLKLQFKPNPSTPLPETDQDVYAFAQGVMLNPQQAFRAVGQLLMVQPETGNLSLNLAATKTLFEALGGKLIVRQRPQQGEVLTIFLPLETPRTTV